MIYSISIRLDPRLGYKQAWSRKSGNQPGAGIGVIRWRRFYVWPRGSLRQGWLKSWTPRAREISDNLNLPEVVISGTWIVEVLQGEAVVQSFETAVPRTELFMVGADLVRVAALGTDNRVGRWASIPLIAD